MKPDFEVELHEGWQYVTPKNERAKAWLDEHEPSEAWECPCCRDVQVYRARDGALLIQVARAAGFALVETTSQAEATARRRA